MSSFGRSVLARTSRKAEEIKVVVVGHGRGFTAGWTEGGSSDASRRREFHTGRPHAAAHFHGKRIRRHVDPPFPILENGRKHRWNCSARTRAGVGGTE